MTECESSWDSSASDPDSEDGLTVDQIVAREVGETEGPCPPTFLRSSGKNLEWDYFLLKKNNAMHVAPVKLFSHAPLAKDDDFFNVDVTIECFNPFVKCDRTVNWVAKVVHFAGYKALIKYETLKRNCKPRFCWMDFFSDVPKPLGYSVKHDILLFPPYDVRQQCPDFLRRLKERILPHRRTVLSSHEKIVQAAVLATQRYKLNDVVEIVDKTFTGRNWLARITGIIGDRVHCSYIGWPIPDCGFWLNCKSELIYDVGFTHEIGFTLGGRSENLKKLFNLKILTQQPVHVQINKGMVFEARHPLLIHRISYCLVSKVLRYGYFVAEFESLEGKESFEFLFHISSPYVFPCGFAKSHGIKLLQPIGENPDFFDWPKFFRKKKVAPLPLGPMKRNVVNKFEVGMKLEAVDLCRPAYVGPATVVRVVEHLLLLHFDGWTRDNEVCYQWVHYESPDIYPLGWCTLVGHELQGCSANYDPEIDTGTGLVPNIV